MITLPLICCDAGGEYQNVGDESPFNYSFLSIEANQVLR
jgi:hypothetical protein